MPTTLLASLKSRGFALEPRLGQLWVSPVSRLTTEDREMIGRHKAALLSLLTGEPLVTGRVVDMDAETALWEGSSQEASERFRCLRVERPGLRLSAERWRGGLYQRWERFVEVIGHA